MSTRDNLTSGLVPQGDGGWADEGLRHALAAGEVMRKRRRLAGASQRAGTPLNVNGWTRALRPLGKA